MMISTRGRYALRIMIDLGERYYEGFVPLKAIAARQHISEKYMEAIIKVLVRAGYVRGLRGKGGGYHLTRHPTSYTAGSILKLLEGSLAPVTCLKCEANPCEYAESCKTLPMWRKLDEIIDSYFENITLWDLMEKTLIAGDYVI